MSRNTNTARCATRIWVRLCPSAKTSEHRLRRMPSSRTVWPMRCARRLGATARSRCTSASICRSSRRSRKWNAWARASTSTSSPVWRRKPRPSSRGCAPRFMSLRVRNSTSIRPSSSAIFCLKCSSCRRARRTRAAIPPTQKRSASLWTCIPSRPRCCAIASSRK